MTPWLISAGAFVLGFMTALLAWQVWRAPLREHEDLGDAWEPVTHTLDVAIDNTAGPAHVVFEPWNANHSVHTGSVNGCPICRLRHAPVLLVLKDPERAS